MKKKETEKCKYRSLLVEQKLQARFENGYIPQRRKKQNKYKQMSLFDQPITRSF